MRLRAWRVPLTSVRELFGVYDFCSELVTGALLHASSNHGEGTSENRREERAVRYYVYDTVII